MLVRLLKRLLRMIDATFVSCVSFSGGADSIEEHRKKGGNPEIDVSYQWLMFFEEDDSKLRKIYDDYKSGKLLTGELKSILVENLASFIKEHKKKREKAKNSIDKFLIEK